MKYKELYTGDTGIFALANEIDSTLISDIFGEVNMSILDSYAYFVASEKTLVSGFTSDTAKGVLTGVLANYGDNWRAKKVALTSDYDPSRPESVKEVTTGTDTTDIVGNDTTTDSSKAYNSTDFVAGEKTERTTDNNNARTYNVTKTTDKSGNEIQKNLENEILFRSRFTLLKVILYDILNEITLSVYE